MTSSRALALVVSLPACAGSTGRAPSAAPAPSASAAVSPHASASSAGPDAAASTAEASDGPAWLGVELASAEPGAAGVLVSGVVHGSPAEKAGLAFGDRILRVGSEPVTRPQDVVRIVSQHQSGERLGIALQRDGADRLLPVVLAARPDPDAMLKLELGDGVAPAWRPLATVRGSAPASLSELRGHVVVVEFWASWCVPCRLSAPTLTGWQNRYGAQGLKVIGITMDAPDVALQASVEMGMDYAVLSDPDGETTRAYKAFALPTLFVIDREGKIRVAQVGYSSSALDQAEAVVRQLLAGGS